jgi:hypothetical protein
MRQIALGILCSGLIATSAFAEEPATTPLRLDRALEGVSLVKPALKLGLANATAAQAADPAPKVTAVVGADIPSTYFFRGYRQETDAKFTFQPFVDIGVQANEKVKLNLGVWNSLHTGSLKDADSGWYETDFYAAVSSGMFKATYTAYTYPNFDDINIQELMFSVAGPGAFAPSAAVAFELHKASGADKGIYLELGVTPAIPMKDDAPVAITIPVRLGFGLKDYYFDGLGEEKKFGYFSGGVSVSKPVNDKFEVHGSVIGYAFGDALETYNGKSGDVVASVGFGITF